MKNFWLFCKNTNTNLFNKSSRKYIIFWLFLSIFFSVFYSYFALKIALSEDYIIQDDARQHVFWMERFIDPQYFPNDIYANYFQEAAPLGYAKFYQFFSFLGIDPILLHKILPLFLGLIATYYIFFFTIEIFPLPFSGFCASIFLNQSLWTRDDLVSATPVAFAVPIFCAFLYYYFKENKILTLLCMALLGLFYPQCLLLASPLVGLRIFRLRNNKIQFSQDINDYIWLFAAGLVTIIVLLPYVIVPSEFGAATTIAEAKTMPVLQPEGWFSYFSPHPFQYWFCGKRSGLFPTDWCRFYRRGLELLPPQLWLCILVPPILYFLKKYSFSLNYSAKKKFLLLQLTFVSVVLFFVAHAVAFRLYLPSRYTEHTLKIVVAVAGAILLGKLLMTILSKMPENTKQILTTAWLVLILVYFPIGYPLLLINQGYEFPSTEYVKGEYPELYKFLEQQPKDILIASVVSEANNLPSFTQRSILVGGIGFAIPYQLDFFQEVEKRTIELIEAQYSTDFQQVSNFINKYGVDFWLLNKAAFTKEYIQQDEWLNAFSYKINTQELYPTQEKTILEKSMTQCTALQADQLFLINVNCLLNLDFDEI